MRSLFMTAAAATACLLATNAASLAQVKSVPYPAVKVELAEAYKPDAAFEKMRKAFADAVAKKDSNALFALVGPTFVWMVQGQLNDQFDPGRDALHNFKVVFGFREFGKDVDGVSGSEPLWDVLAAFASDQSHYSGTAGLVCGPTTATIADETALERAQARIGADESLDWYFVVAPVTVMSAPAEGKPVGRADQIALPILGVHPPGESQDPTHLEVLLPAGRRGWIPISAARPFSADRLCYAATGKGEWKIAFFDQAE